MKKTFLSVFVITCALFFGSVLADAAEPTTAELMKEIKALKQRVTYLEGQLSSQASSDSESLKCAPGKAMEIPGTGIDISAGATFIVQGAIDANNTSKTDENVTDASYSMNLALEKEFGDMARVFLHLETGDGAGVEDELGIFSNVNRDADDSDNSISISEAWYEHYLFDKQISLTAGKLDSTCYLDQNEIANCECTQFLGRIFRNAPTVDFPGNTAGMHAIIALENISWLELEGQVLDADDDFEDIGDDLFISYQVNLKPVFLENLSGNYRVYGWCSDANYIEWKDAAEQFKRKHGLGISIDQQLSEAFTVFGRYGWSDPDLYLSGDGFSLEHTWSTGCQLNGASWGRENDHIAAAVGMAIPSGEYKDAGTNLKAENETHLEAYYSYYVNEHFTLSPDIQVIWNPYGDDYTVNDEERNDTATIIGCRGQVDF